MKDTDKLSLKEEIEKEAAIVEEKILDNPELDGIEASSEMDFALSEKINKLKSHKNHEDA